MTEMIENFSILECYCRSDISFRFRISMIYDFLNMSAAFSVRVIFPVKSHLFPKYATIQSRRQSEMERSKQNTSEKTIKSICENPLFEKISTEDLGRMFDCLGCHTGTFAKGEYILLENDSVPNIGIITQGKVEIIKEDIWGRRTILMRLKEQDMLGETFSCSRDNTSSVSYQAVANTTIVFMPFSRVMHTCRKTCAFHHRLIENMVSIIAKKNRRLMLKAEIISSRSLREKLMTLFSQMVEETGSYSFTLPMGRVALAEYIGSDRSALTRELKSMQDEGLIEFEKNDFTILL